MLYLEEWGALTLDIGEAELDFEGTQVYSHASGGDNLAFLMFRDGLRSLSLRPGLEATEIEAIVDCLAHADDLSPVEQDLVTAFWEQDFAHVEYWVADPLVAGEAIRDGMIDALRQAVQRRLEEGEAPDSVEECLKWQHMYTVVTEKIDPALLVVTVEEQEREAGAIEALRDVLEEYVDVLLEIADSAPITSIEDPLAQAFVGAMQALVDQGKIDKMFDVAGQLVELEGKEWCPAGFAGAVIGGGLGSQRLRSLLEAAGTTKAGEGNQIEGFLMAVRSWIGPLLLEALAEAEDRGVRKSLLSVLGAEDGVPWSDLEPFLSDSRWYVVRNAVQLAAGARHMGLAEHGPRLLSHPDSRVRRETLRGLEILGAKDFISLFARTLSDEESTVRTLAARVVGRDGGRDQEAALLSHIEDRGFAALPAEEVGAFLTAYASLAQERSLPVLQKLWKRRLLSARPLALRLAAVEAIGAVHSEAAHTLLITLSKSGEAQIRAAAQRALFGPGFSGGGGRS